MSREAEKYFEVVSGRWDFLRKSFYGDEVRDAVLAAARVLPTVEHGQVTIPMFLASGRRQERGGELILFCSRR